MDFKIVAMQDTYSPTLEEVKKDPMEQNSMLDLFIRSLITLKTNVKLKYLAKDNPEELEKDITLAKINVQTFVLIKSLKLFIKWYSEKADNSIITFIQEELLKRKEDLYFSDLKVDFEENDLETLMTIVDALGVKFYQEVILLIDTYFNTKDQVFTIEADEKNNKYTMGYRNMNIMEIDNKRKGKLNVNIKA